MSPDEINSSLAQVAKKLVDAILEENSFDGNVILLITPRSFESLVGGPTQSAIIQREIVKLWKDTAEKYGRTESAEYFDLPTCLLIAVFQSLKGFQESGIAGDELTLGESFAKAWGEIKYSSRVGSKYFNPSECSVDSRLSFQYRIWTFLQKYFEDVHQLHLHVPDPKPFRGRYLQFVKAQVHLTESDIQEISAILNESVDFQNHPSDEAIHHLLFSRWHKFSEGFAPRLREVINESSDKGNLERFYSKIVAAYYDKNARLESAALKTQNDGKNYPLKGGKQQLRLELNAGIIKFVLFDLTCQTFAEFSNKAALRDFFTNSPDHFLLFYEEDPSRPSKEYVLLDRLIPINRALVALCIGQGDGHETLYAEWEDQYVFGLKIYYRRFNCSTSLPIELLKCRQEHSSSRLSLLGGLKHPASRTAYLVDAGPRIAQKHTVAKVGYGNLSSYDEYSVTEGRYNVCNTQFDVSAAGIATPSPDVFGFDLSCWSYSSDSEKINLTGLTVSNPLPPPVTRRWIDKQLIERSLATKCNDDDAKGRC